MALWKRGEEASNFCLQAGFICRGHVLVRSMLLAQLHHVVDPEGFEPPTPWFEAKCSIQLSYGSTLAEENATVPIF